MESGKAAAIGEAAGGRFCPEAALLWKKWDQQCSPLEWCLPLKQWRTKSEIKSRTEKDRENLERVFLISGLMETYESDSTENQHRYHFWSLTWFIFFVNTPKFKCKHLIYCFVCVNLKQVQYVWQQFTSITTSLSCFAQVTLNIHSIKEHFSELGYCLPTDCFKSVSSVEVRDRYQLRICPSTASSKLYLWKFSEFKEKQF